MSHKRKIVVFIKIMLIIVAFLIYRYWVTSKKASVDDINDLVPISLNGIITSIKYQSHGFYYIGIFDKMKNDTLKYILSGHRLFSDKYNIKIGDSISKDTNSIMATFHSYESKGVYKKGIVYKLP